LATDDPLVEALRAAHARWSRGSAERFPVENNWEPLAAGLGTDKANKDQQLKSAVPRVPRVPSEKQYTSHCTTQPDVLEAWTAWMERAAVREYDGGMSRAEADTRTALELGPCPALRIIGRQL